MKAKKPDPEMIDNDNPEWTDEMFKRAAHPTPAVKAFIEMAKRSRGRPKADTTKVLLSVRYDKDVVEAFKATGKGWQGRMNETLRDNMPK